MTKTLILAAAALAFAGCADEAVETETPIGADTPVLDGPAEVVTEPMDDAMMDSGAVAAPGTIDDGIMLDDDATMTEGETMTDDGM